MPEKAIEILLASLSKSTLVQYESALKAWWSFCQESREEFFSPSINKVLTFLTEKFESGASYATLNTYRSAISLISNNKIGNNQIICRFLKGVFNKRPQKPKYSYTCDVAIVLNYLEKLYPLETLSLTQLTEKTVTLLALCTAHRAQTLASIKITNIQKIRNSIYIKIDDKIKTSGPGKFQPLLIFHEFKDNPSLCVAKTLDRYLQVTQSLRGQENRLFIATRKPFLAVSSQTLARWIKKVLLKSGIDVLIFTAHSVRHAATSIAFAKGISLDTIRKTAGWTDSSRVFARFYNKSVIEEEILTNSFLVNKT